MNEAKLQPPLTAKQPLPTPLSYATPSYSLFLRDVEGYAISIYQSTLSRKSTQNIGYFPGKCRTKWCSVQGGAQYSYFCHLKLTNLIH